MRKSVIVSWAIVAIVLIVTLIIANQPKQETPEALTKCIGANSILYIQLGCSHCKDQEDLFGDNKKFLTTVDCFYEGAKCADIKATPTWVINGKKHEGIQSIETLRELTGC